MIRATDIVLAVDKNKSRRIRDKSREREKHDLHICEMYLWNKKSLSKITHIFQMVWRWHWFTYFR